MFRKWMFLILVPMMLQADDFQWWGEAVFEHPLKNDWTLEVKFQTRFKNDATKAYHYYWQVNLVKELSCGWSIAPGYKHIYELDDFNHWEEDPVPLLAIMKDWEWCKYKFQYRNRIEYHTGQPQKWHDRSRFQLEFPKEIFGWHPLFYDEVFFRENEGYYQNRFFAGAKYKGWKVGYIRRVDRAVPHWIGKKILFVGFNLEI